MNNEIDKFDPTSADWLELIDGLREQVQQGRLKSMTFLLVDPRMPDNAMIDSWGSPELTEIACRKTLQEIALAQEIAGNAALAKAIRDAIPSERVLQ